MTIGTTFWMANEDLDYNFIGSTITVTTNAFLLRPTWSRTAIRVSNGSTTDPPSPRLEQNKKWPAGAEQAGWMRRFLAWDAFGGSSTLNATMFRLLDGTGGGSPGVARLMVRGVGSNAVKISKRDASGVFTDLVTTANNALPIGGLSPFPMDFHWDFTEVITSGARTDISFTVGPPGVLTTVGGDFVLDGFTNGGTVTIAGSASNDSMVQIATVTAHTMTLTGSNVFVAESAGNSITITATGTVRLYFNDNIVAYFAGGIDTDGVTSLQQADFASPSTSAPVFWSEDLVSDTITINAGVFSLPPLAPGTTQDWAGAVGDINDTTINDTNFISSGTADQLSGWTTPIVFPAGAWAIQSISQSARVAVGTTGPQHFDWYVHVNATHDELAGVSNAPALTFGDFSSFIWADNPNTAVPWVLTDITDPLSEFNLGVKSLT